MARLRRSSLRPGVAARSAGRRAVFIGSTDPRVARPASDMPQAGASLEDLAGGEPWNNPSSSQQPATAVAPAASAPSAPETLGVDAAARRRRTAQAAGRSEKRAAHRPAAEVLWNLVATVLGVRQRAAPEVRRSKWRWVAVGLVVVASLAVVGAASTPWVNGTPLVVTSGAAHHLTAYRQATKDQDDLAGDVRAAENAGLDITTITDAQTSAQGRCISISTSARRGVDQKLFGALSAECTAAVSVISYLANTARAAGAAPSQLAGAEKTFSGDYGVVQHLLQEARP